MRTSVTLLLSVVACAEPGYDPVVSGQLVIPASLTVPSNAVLTVTLWQPAEPTPVQLAQIQRRGIDELSFELELASGSALLTATLDLTGDGWSSDDLVAELEVNQGDLDIELVLHAQPETAR